MNDTRKKMLDRVKAILAKTMSNGCTEGEAMAALAKARELMAAYEISESELGQHETEGAMIHKYDQDDEFGVRKRLALAVGLFTRCRCWDGKNRGYGVTFCGLESDVIFATWLLDTLQQFVLRALKAHKAHRKATQQRNSRVISKSFVVGCTQRINQRLAALTPPAPLAMAKNALVVSRNALITEAMAKDGIELTQPKPKTERVIVGAFNAGAAAGDQARFNRPVGAGGALLLR